MLPDTDCLMLASQNAYLLFPNNMIFLIIIIFGTSTAIKYILKTYKFFHSDVIISSVPASRILPFLELL